MSPDGEGLHVLVADDHPIFRQGVVAILTAAGLSVVGEAATGTEALCLILNLRPVIALVDISMPELNGISVIERSVSAGCPTRMIVLSLHEERLYIERSLAAGARGYLLKRSTGDSLLHAVRAVALGGVYLDPVVAGRYVAMPGSRATRSAPRAERAGSTLTLREEDVTRLVAQGYTGKEVAGKLGISAKSVETHKARASEKLGIAGRARLVEYARLRGWLDGSSG